MKTTIKTLVLIVLAINFCNAQKIEIKKTFGGYQYLQDGKRMTMKALTQTMETNTEAFHALKKFKSNNTLSGIIGAAGGALVGFPIGTSIGGGNPNWTLAGIGAGLIVVAIPIASSANKHAKKAVELYNASLETTSFVDFKPEFNVIANSHGIGLSMRF